MHISSLGGGGRAALQVWACLLRYEGDEAGVILLQLLPHRQSSWQKGLLNRARGAGAGGEGGGCSTDPVGLLVRVEW